ncbi:hypothetical protein EV401DRAFT_1893352 [Pisolithus croceorrhizus]|nr:hypothetical protein EV401DRAFT_1893352 [Pisolithus croceorrhizus]
MFISSDPDPPYTLLCRDEYVLQHVYFGRHLSPLPSSHLGVLFDTLSWGPSELVLQELIKNGLEDARLRRHGIIRQATWQAQLARSMREKPKPLYLFSSSAPGWRRLANEGGGGRRTVRRSSFSACYYYSFPYVHSMAEIIDPSPFLHASAWRDPDLDSAWRIRTHVISCPSPPGPFPNVLGVSPGTYGVGKQLSFLALGSTLQDHPNSIAWTSSALPLRLCHSGIYTCAVSVRKDSLVWFLHPLPPGCHIYTPHCLMLPPATTGNRRVTNAEWQPGNIFAILGSLLHKIQYFFLLPNFRSIKPILINLPRQQDYHLDHVHRGALSGHGSATDQLQITECVGSNDIPLPPVGYPQSARRVELPPENVVETRVAPTSVPKYQGTPWSSQHAQANHSISTTSTTYTVEDGWSSITEGQPVQLPHHAIPVPITRAQVPLHNDYFDIPLVNAVTPHFEGDAQDHASDNIAYPLIALSSPNPSILLSHAVGYPQVNGNASRFGGPPFIQDATAGSMASLASRAIPCEYIAPGGELTCIGIGIAVSKPTPTIASRDLFARLLLRHRKWQPSNTDIATKTHFAEAHDIKDMAADVEVPCRWCPLSVEKKVVRHNILRHLRERVAAADLLYQSTPASRITSSNVPLCYVTDIGVADGAATMDDMSHCAWLVALTILAGSLAPKSNFKPGEGGALLRPARRQHAPDLLKHVSSISFFTHFVSETAPYLDLKSHRQSLLAGTISYFLDQRFYDMREPTRASTLQPLATISSAHMERGHTLARHLSAFAVGQRHPLTPNTDPSLRPVALPSSSTALSEPGLPKDRRATVSLYGDDCAVSTTLLASTAFTDLSDHARAGAQSQSSWQSEQGTEYMPLSTDLSTGFPQRAGCVTVGLCCRRKRESSIINSSIVVFIRDTTVIKIPAADEDHSNVRGYRPLCRWTYDEPGLRGQLKYVMVEAALALTVGTAFVG